MYHKLEFAGFDDEFLPLEDRHDRLEIAPVILLSFGIENNVFEID